MMARAQEEPEPLPGVPASLIGGENAYRLVVDHLESRAVLLDDAGREQGSWSLVDDAPVISVPPNRPISFEVTNANPLLYSYDLSSAVVRADRVALCGDVAGGFLAEGFLLGGTVLDTTEPLGLEDFAGRIGLDLDALPGFSADTRATEGSLTAMQLATYLGVIRAEVRAVTQRVNRVVTAMEAAPDSAERIAWKAETRPLPDLVGAYRAYLNSIQAGLGDPARAPSAVEAAFGDSEDIQLFRSLSKSIAEGAFGGPSSDPGYIEVSAAAAELDALAARAEVALPAFQARLSQLSRAARRSLQRFAIRESRGSALQLTLRVQATEGFPDVFRSRTGALTVYARPRVRFQCAVGMGVFWASPLPEYALDDDGLLEDLSGGDNLSVSPALILDVRPATSPIGVVVGLGAGRGAVPDLYAGGSLRITPGVTIDAGYTWRRARELPAGLSEGDRLPEFTSVGDFNYGFQRSFFWGLALQR